MFKNFKEIFYNLTHSIMSWFKLIERKLNHRVLPDKLYLSILYKTKFGKKLDWQNPKTFNEKLQWLKVYDRRPEYTIYVDKYKVREYISKTIGEEYLIPLLGVWGNPDEIDFDKLPNQFVLKCNHDSAGLCICKNKSTFNIETAKQKLRNSLRRDYSIESREWPYKNVPRKIIAEKYMEDFEQKELRDYKFFCFDGNLKAMFIATDRFNNKEETKFDFFDMDFNHLNLKHGHPNANIPPQKPKNFELMKELAKKLSNGIPQIRIDFYEINGKVFFGEMTLFHHTGLVPFVPYKWDYIFLNGGWIGESKL